jgi:hypothetical protein
MAGKGADLWRDQTARGWRFQFVNRPPLFVCFTSLVSSWPFHYLNDISVHGIRHFLDRQR